MHEQVPHLECRQSDSGSPDRWRDHPEFDLPRRVGHADPGSSSPDRSHSHADALSRHAHLTLVTCYRYTHAAHAVSRCHAAAERYTHIAHAVSHCYVGTGHTRFSDPYPFANGDRNDAAPYPDGHARSVPYPNTTDTRAARPGPRFVTRISRVAGHPGTGYNDRRGAGSARAATVSEDGRVEATVSSFPERARLTPGTLWRLTLGLALGLALLAVAVRGIEPGEVLAGLAEANPVWVTLAFLTVLLTTLAKVGRWWGLFPAAQRPGYFLLFRALLVGQLANALLPARVGELVRVYLVGAGGEISKATALGTVAAEKTFDVLFLLICAGLAFALAPMPPWLDASLAGLAAGGVLILILALALPQQRVLTWTERWVHRLPWGVGERLAQALRSDVVYPRGLTGLAALREPRMALVACAWSATIWALAAGTNHLLFWAFDLPLSAGAALLLLVLLHVGVAPPSSPGRLGIFHALTVLGLAAFGVDRSSGLAYATVLHLIVYLPQVLPGAVVLGLGRRSA